MGTQAVTQFETQVTNYLSSLEPRQRLNTATMYYTAISNPEGDFGQRLKACCTWAKAELRVKETMVSITAMRAQARREDIAESLALELSDEDRLGSLQYVIDYALLASVFPERGQLSC